MLVYGEVVVMPTDNDDDHDDGKISFKDRPVMMICVKERIQETPQFQAKKRHKAMLRTLI